MRILGVDPGTATTGIGIIEGERNSGFKSISYTCIKTDSKLPIEERLKLIYDSLDAIIKESKPDLISVEELFFNSNPKTAMSVGRACGAIILCASHNNLKVVEHTPLEVKSAVVGFGHAEKIQVQKMITKLLKLSEMPKPDDAADALAIAYCAGVSLTR